MKFEIPEIKKENPYKTPDLNKLIEGDMFQVLTEIKPYFDNFGVIKHFEILRSFRLRPPKKEQKQEPKETLDSFVDEDEKI